ncbi:MAG: invasion protein regulator [Mucilaginibacter sp.]|nr:invasion protein regulator [Mucilaginibacter sp.]
MKLKVNKKDFKYSGGNRFVPFIFMPLFFLLLMPHLSRAQVKAVAKNNTVKSSATIDTGAVKQMFFSALREKTIENNNQASEMFNRILQIDPGNDASMYELANLNKLKKNYQDAEMLLKKAVSLKPDNEWYWVSLADIYEKSNDLPKLENVFNELKRINPDKPEYYFDCANAYFLDKKYDEALKVYDQLEKITGPTDELVINREKIYLKQGKVDMAAAGLEERIAADPNQIKYYLLLAEIYNSNGFNDKALKVLEKAKKIAPNNGLIHLALADIYRDKKNNEACFNELTIAFAIPDVDVEQKVRIVLGYLPKFPDPNAKASALTLSKILAATSPTDAKANALYGDMLFQNEKYADAKAAYQKSIAINNQIYEVHEQLVRIELSSNDMDAVIKDGENTLSFFPNQAWMNYFVGIAWFQKKDYNKALSYIKNSDWLETQDKQLLTLSYSALGDNYHELKDIKGSDAAYEKALIYNPDNVYTLNNYAYYLSTRGEQLEKAAQMAKHANELQPKSPSFEDTYAWILFKQKKYADAKIWIQKALADDKGKSAVQTEHYGDIVFFLGDVDGAVSNWKKAKEYGGASPVLDRKINEKKYIE